MATRLTRSNFSIFLGLLVSFTALFGPPSVADPAVVLWSVLVALIVWRSSNRIDGPAKSVFRLVATSALLLIVGIVVRTLHGEAIGIDQPLPSYADLLHVPGYIAFVLATLRVHQARAKYVDLNAWIESAVMTVALTLVLWAGFMHRFFLDPAVPTSTRALNAFYTLAVLSMAALLLRVSATPAKRPTAYRLLGGASASFLVADLAATYATAAGEPFYITVALSPIVYGFVLAAAVHPTASEIADASEEHEPELDPSRIGMVAVAAVTPIAIVALFAPTGATLQVSLGGSILLAALVTIRVLRLVYLHQQAAQNDRQLASGVAQLAALDSGTAVLNALPRIAGEIAGGAFDVSISSETNAVTDFPISIVNSGGERTAYGLTLSPAPQQPALRRVLGSLMRQAELIATSADALAMRAAQQSEAEANRRIAKNEKRFRALVQHASDIIIVVDELGVVRYISEPIEGVLGYRVSEFEGRNLEWVVHENDFESATAYFAATLNGLARDDVHEFRAIAENGEMHLFETVMTDMRDTEGVEGIVLNCSDVTDRRTLERNLRDAETIDMLTLLLNRNAFIEETSQALRRASISATGVAIAIIDLDNFREINEGLGPVVADQTLVEVAQRLRRAARVGDVVARLNGDEFAILMADSVSATEAVAATERVLEQIVGTVSIRGREVSIEASAGVSRNAEGSVMATKLLRDGDTALGHAKANSLGSVVLFDESMAEAVTTKLEIRNRLESALKNNELRLVYQPIVDSQTERIVSMEALARWRHPSGDISPAVFIPIAEESNLIGQLGEWAFRQACTQVAEWYEQGWSDFTVSVNISGHQLHEEGIIHRLETILSDTGVDPSRIIMELTESVLIDETDFIRHRLESIRGLGLQLAIDDFGTGYSSLSYLQRYEFDILKIDRSFVTPLADANSTREREIVSSMISLARGLEAITVAEGIEEEQELRTLRELDVDRIQGFLFHRPTEVENIQGLLRLSNRASLAFDAAA